MWAQAAAEPQWCQFFFYPWTSSQSNDMIPHWLPTAGNTAAQITAAGGAQDINTPVTLRGGEPVLLPSSAS